MSEIILTKIIFGIFLSIGSLTLLFLAFKFYYKYMIQEKRCTAKTKGIIKKYTFLNYGGEGTGIHLPVVFYYINNMEYHIVGPEYKWYISTIKSSPFSKNETNYKENNQVFYINKTLNSFVGISSNPMANLYPINSEIDVYYDPNNPKLAYVLRYCNNKWIFYLMFFSGILVLILDIAILLFCK